MTRVAVISDTHFPSRGSDLPPACVARLANADMIVHAGDVADGDTLRMLDTFGVPVVVVKGNVDAATLGLPTVAAFTVEGLSVAVVHNGGPEAGRVERMRKRFPDANLVIFGHSHIPLLMHAPDGFTILNPGSPSDKRQQPFHTMAEIEVPPGGPTKVGFWAVDEPSGPLPWELVRGARVTPTGCV